MYLKNFIPQIVGSSNKPCVNLEDFLEEDLVEIQKIEPDLRTWEEYGWNIIFKKYLNALLEKKLE